MAYGCKCRNCGWEEKDHKTAKQQTILEDPDVECHPGTVKIGYTMPLNKCPEFAYEEKDLRRIREREEEKNRKALEKMKTSA